MSLMFGTEGQPRCHSASAHRASLFARSNHGRWLHVNAALDLMDPAEWDTVDYWKVYIVWPVGWSIHC